MRWRKQFYPQKFNMSLRIKRYSSTAQQEVNPMEVDSTLEQRETTYEGYTFHWAMNESRSFLDDGVGAGHARFGAKNVREDEIPYGSSRS